MKAIVIPTPNEIEIRELPMPEIHDGEALLKVRYVGICGADLASYTGNQPFTTYPRIPGHEFSAEIVEIPENDKGLKPGDIVTIQAASGPVLRAAAVLYMLPLALFFLGYFLGSSLWGAGAVVGGGAFIMGIAGSVLYDRAVVKKQKTVYTITGFVRMMSQEV